MCFSEEIFMNLSCKDIFNIVKETWALNQNSIAKYIERDPATISRVMSGKTKKINYEINKLYKQLFDNTNKDSPTCGIDGTHLLTELTKTMEKLGFEEIIKDLCGCDYESFVRELLRRAQENPQSKGESRTAGKSSAALNFEAITPDNSKEEVVKNKGLQEQIQDKFIKLIEEFNIMNIINRKPAVFNRDDSSNLNVFLRKLDVIITNPYKSNSDSFDIYENIKIFKNMLRIETMTIDAGLNNRFSFEDDSALINMEDEGELLESKIPANTFGIPEITQELILESVNPIGVMNIGIREWGNFRNEINLLYKKIYESSLI